MSVWTIVLVIAFLLFVRSLTRTYRQIRAEHKEMEQFHWRLRRRYGRKH